MVTSFLQNGVEAELSSFYLLKTAARFCVNFFLP